VFRYANRLTPEALAKLLNLLGRFYNNALIAIELTGNLGLWAQARLRDTFSYRNLYRWKGRDDKLEVGGARVSTSIGWETTSRTRPLLLSAFRGGIREGEAILHDKLTLEQMRSAENKSGRWEVDDNVHDDILMAAMIGWMSLKQWYTSPPSGRMRRVLETGLSVAEQDKKSLPTYSGETALVRAQHWNTLMKTIKRGGPARNRLEGV
jgi:hypothetical protein